MIFAAGFGTRMNYSTTATPKALLKVGNQCLIDIVIDRLIEYGIERIVINCHYLADQIITHVHNKPRIIISYEEEILETGGGLAKALPILGMGHLITVNADTIWYSSDLLTQLTQLWNDNDKPDLTMAFCHSIKWPNHKGNFDILSDKSVQKNANGDFIYAGVQIINPQSLSRVYKKYFSISEIHNLLLNNNDTKSNVYGLEYNNKIYHVGSTEELAMASTADQFAIHS